MPDVQKAALPSDVLGKAMNGIAKRLLKLNGMKDTLDGASANDLVKKSGPHNTLVLSWVIPSIEHQLKISHHGLSCQRLRKQLDDVYTRLDSSMDTCGTQQREVAVGGSTEELLGQIKNQYIQDCI